MTDPDSPDDLEAWPVLDESFVQAASVKERSATQPGPKPSRESLREVKREAKQRKRSAKQAAKPQNRYHGVQWKRPVLFGVLLAVALGSVAWFGWAYAPAGISADEQLSTSEARELRKEDRRVDPWAGTKAARWPTRITAPRPTPVGIYSKADTDAATLASLRFLRASMLDPQVLDRGKVDPVLSTFSDPEYMRERLGSTRTDASWTNLATRFQPGKFSPVGDPVRLQGHLTPVMAGGHLAVNYSYSAAYALRSLVRPDRDPELVVVRHEGTLTFYEASPASVGLPHPTSWAGASDHSACKQPWPLPAYTPVWYDDQVGEKAKHAAAKTTHDLTDPDDSLLKDHGCFTITGDL